ncbi:MAG: thiamine ABC transporter substrate-binding protein [Candidatus Tenebribacter burtonii]|jgi:thiamine transport system substrate-binding protein|nr:thiamine ABC transporter substrate-binding protein [Candidatus Tenebribacter burtonii]
MKKIITFLIIILVLSCNKQNENEIPKKIRTLNIYAVDVFLNEDFYENIIPIFTDIIECEIVITKFTDALSMLEKAISEKDSTDIDVLIGIDNTLLFLAEEDSLLLQYESNNLLDIHEDLIFDKKHQINPVCYSNIAFNYNSYIISDPPITFGEMQDGKFKDQIILMDPRTSSIGRAMLYWSVAAFGRNGYGHFWRSIKENVFSIFDNQNDAYNAYLAGEAPMIVGLETTPIYHIQHDNTNKYKSTIPKEGGFKFIIGVGILKSSQKEYLSKKFVDFLLSKEFQELITKEMWMKPVNRKVMLPVDYEILPQITKDFTNELSTRRTSWQYNEWITKWKRIMLN